MNLDIHDAEVKRQVNRRYISVTSNENNGLLDTRVVTVLNIYHNIANSA